jgi:hypothetical protein
MNERDFIRRAAQYAALKRQLGKEFGQSEEPSPHPLFWPTLPEEEREREMGELRDWVRELYARFPPLTKLPECWWRHNQLVEILVALRDAENGCYAEGAPLMGGVEWHRLLRDMEGRLNHWVKRLPCGITQPGHVD